MNEVNLKITYKEKNTVGEYETKEILFDVKTTTVVKLSKKQLLIKDKDKELLLLKKDMLGARTDGYHPDATALMFDLADY